MTSTIFQLVKWYALLRGAQKALKKREPMSVLEFDQLLMRFFLGPVQEELNRPSMLLRDWN